LINVLLIAYYWPPSGGGGVQRWLKMSKYFPYDKMNLFVYTPENPEYPAYDDSLVEQVNPNITVIKHPITEPYAFYKKFTGKKKDEKVYSGFINDKKSWKQDLAVWIRSNFFIPDARFMWIKPSIKFLKKKLDEHSIDVVISTGPPHSVHLIANGLIKFKPTVKWIADFRDPWTNIDFYKQLKLSKWADKKHHKLEKKVAKSADSIVTIGWTMQEEFKKIGERQDVEIITNGYDHEDFQQKCERDSSFSVLHLGSLNEDRNPSVLWQAIREIRDSEKLVDDFVVQLIGNVDQSIHHSIVENQLESLVEFEPFITHQEAINRMKAAHVLLLIINNSPNAKGILTGKAFEYLGASKPILCIGPENGDMRKLLRTFEHVRYVPYGEIQKCKDALLDLMYEMDESHVDASQYSRKELAKKYFKLIVKTSA